MCSLACWAVVGEVDSFRLKYGFADRAEYGEWVEGRWASLLDYPYSCGAGGHVMA